MINGTSMERIKKLRFYAFVRAFMSDRLYP